MFPLLDSALPGHPAWLVWVVHGMHSMCPFLFTGLLGGILWQVDHLGKAPWQNLSGPSLSEGDNTFLPSNPVDLTEFTLPQRICEIL